MQYMIMAFETPEGASQRNGPNAQAYWGSWSAYTKELQEAGVMVGGNGLKLPETATTVRVKDGKRHVHDGPYADTKERLGGYYIIDVPDLDTAIEWAERCPCTAYGGVEVRPVLTM